jgi:hypothetical protein
VTKVNKDRKDFKDQLEPLGLKVSKDQQDLVAYLVQMDRKALEDLQEQLDHRVQQDRKGKLEQAAPEEKLVQRAIGASLVLKDLLEIQDPQDQEGCKDL